MDSFRQKSGGADTPAPDSARVEGILAGLGMTLPRPSKAVGIYVPVAIHSRLAYVAGHGPLRADRSLVRGKVGADVTPADAREAAKITALNMLATLKKALGSLDRVERPARVLGFINAAPGFKDHRDVMHGFMDVLLAAYGEHNLPALAVFGAQSLPDGICVEVEAIFELRD